MGLMFGRDEDGVFILPYPPWQQHGARFFEIHQSNNC